MSDLRPYRVVVIGDVMLDKTTHVKTSRISPESENVLVVEEEFVTYKAGAAANVAMNLKSLGADVHLMTVGANDEQFDTLRGLFDAAKLSYSARVPKRGTTTTVKHRVRTKDGQLLRIDRNSAVDESLEEYTIGVDESLLSESSVLVLSDYGRGTLSEDTCQAWIRYAKDLGIPVLADPHRSHDWGRFSGWNVILKPNATQLRGHLGDPEGRDYDSFESVCCAKHALEDEGLSLYALWVTLGASGMALCLNGVSEDEGYRAVAHPRPIEVFDVTGAGDSALATMAYYLSTQGKSTQEMVQWGPRLWDGMELANIAGGISVTRPGVYCVTTEDLLTQQSCDILTEPSSLLSQAVRDNRLIVFTNGCFDLLHAGHIGLFWQAKTLEWCPQTYNQLVDTFCGNMPSTRAAFNNIFLVVGVDSDESVADLKGSPDKTRPVQDERMRYCALKNLPFVDEVVMFHHDELPEPPVGWDETRVRTKSLTDLIQSVKPHVLVKGAEYSDVPHSEIPGAEYVENRGGRLLHPPQMLTVSTTSKAKAGSPEQLLDSRLFKKEST